MQEILQTSPVILIAIGLILFAFAVVMQPIFVWIICARLKRTNQLLARLEKQGAPRMDARQPVKPLPR